MLSFLFLLNTGCTPEKTTETAEPQPKPVLVDVLLLDAIQGDAMGNVTLTSTLDSQTTDNTGTATILVEEETNITIEASAGGYPPHHLELASGRINYEVVSLMASSTASVQIYGLLSPPLIPDESKGIVIVALDNPDLSPAVGAKASISVESDDSFVLTGISAQYGNEVLPNGGGFVAIPNVAPGEATISVESPEGSTCVHHVAGETEQATIDIKASTVHVVFFICQ